MCLKVACLVLPGHLGTRHKTRGFGTEILRISHHSSFSMIVKRQRPWAQNTGSRKKPRVMYGRAPPMRAQQDRRARMQAVAGLRLEPKTVDAAPSSMRFSNDSAVANSMLLFNTIPTGTSSITRVGKRVNLKAVAIRGSINAASATTVEKCTLLLIYIRTPNQGAALPAWNTILASQSSNSLTNRDNASKFKIIRRWDFSVSGNSTTPQTSEENYVVEEFVKLGGLPSVWTNASTAGTIDEFEEGALILGTVGGSNYGATVTPLFSGSTRVYFEDR